MFDFSILFSLILGLKQAKDGRFYLVLNGKCKYLPKGTIIHRPTEDAASPQVTTNKEEVMKVISYLMTDKEYQEVRVITNCPDPDILGKYNSSAKSKTPVDGLMAIDHGLYQPWLLIHRANDRKIKFQLEITTNGVLNHLIGGDASTEEKKRFVTIWSNKVAKSNFAWANASSSFFLRFPGIDAWGLEPLGITANDYPKLGKRGNEIARSAKMAVHIEDPSLFPKVVTDDSLPKASADGWSFISKRFALMHTATISDPAERKRMEYLIRSGKVRRFTLRAKGIEGGKMVKGHCVIMPNSVMKGADIITHPENIKGEVNYNGFLHSTLEEYHPVGEAAWDVQRLVMNPIILTAEHRQRDLKSFVDDLMNTIATGEIPSWLVYSAPEHTDASDIIGSNREFYKLEADAIMRWQAAGLPFHAASNMARMAFGALLNKMARGFDKYIKGTASGSSKSMYLPKSNAFVAAIGCHDSLVNMGGYKTTYDGTKAWLDPTIGVIIPGHRTSVLGLWGGADFDDSVEFNLVKIWSSDPNVTKTMRLHGVIGENEVVPDNPDHAVYRAAGLRAPNNPGEYAFLEFENILDLPWQSMNIDTVEVIDLANLPDPAPVMVSKSKVVGITPSLVHSKAPWTRQNAIEQILAQQKNIGIGQAANAIMAWCGAAGPSMPPVITAQFEQLVDGAQQLHDPAIFAAVTQAAKSVSTQTLDYLKNTGGKIDRYLIDRFVGIKHQMAAREYTYDGPLYQFQEDYKAAILKIYTELEQQVLQRRAKQPIVRWISQLNFRQEAQDWASDFDQRYTRRLNSIESKHKAVMSEIEALQGKNSIVKTAATRNKMAEVRTMVDEMINEINTFERPGQRVLALWQWMVRPAGGIRKLGGYDRLMFQQGNNGSLMDILIDTIHARIETDETLQKVFDPSCIQQEEDEALIPESIDLQEVDAQNVINQLSLDFVNFLFNTDIDTD